MDLLHISVIFVPLRYCDFNNSFGFL